MRIRSFKGPTVREQPARAAAAAARGTAATRPRAGVRTAAASARCDRRTCSASSASTARTSSSCSPARTCCRRSSSSSAAPAAMRAVQQVRRVGRAADLAGGARRDPRDRRGAHAHAARRGPRRARLLGVARQPRARRRRPPRRAAARRSRRSSRSSSSASSSRSSSPPRPSPSASTCRRAPSCSRSSRSSTAKRASRSPRGSTPSSPDAPAGAASTSRGTRSSSGPRALDPQAVAALASRRTYPLNSSFRPTYNMAVNLIDQFGRARAREILESSFAQFQADRAVVGLARQVREQEESLAGYEKAMTCDRGDFAEYSGIRRELSDLEKLNRKDATAPRGDARAAAARDRSPAQADAAASVPSVPRPRGARPLGGAVLAAQAARSTRCASQIEHAHRHGRAHLRPRRRRAARCSTTSRSTRRARRPSPPPGARCGASTASATCSSPSRCALGLWKDLDAASLAALACCLVYEPRRDDGGAGRARAAARTVPRRR